MDVIAVVCRDAPPVLHVTNFVGEADLGLPHDVVEAEGSRLSGDVVLQPVCSMIHSTTGRTSGSQVDRGVWPQGLQSSVSGQRETSSKSGSRAARDTLDSQPPEPSTQPALAHTTRTRRGKTVRGGISTMVRPAKALDQKRILGRARVPVDVP